MGFFKLGCDKQMCANIQRVKCSPLVHIPVLALKFLSYLLAVYYPVSTMTFLTKFFSKSVQVHADDNITNITTTYGYVFGYKEEYCFVNATRRTCLYDQTNELVYPWSMIFVQMAVWSNYFVFFVLYFIRLALACFDKDRELEDLCGVKIVLFVCAELLQLFAYTFFVFVIGPEVGFTRNDLDVGFYLAVTIPIALPGSYFITTIWGRFTDFDTHVCEFSKAENFIYIEYKEDTTIFPHQHTSESTTNLLSENLHLDEIVFKPLTSTKDSYIENGAYINDLMAIVLELWTPQLVGIGRDAFGLSHLGINVTEVKHLYDRSLLKNYLKRKATIAKFAKTIGGKLAPPECYKEGTKPVQTASIFNRYPELQKNIDQDLNEVYLFHGTEAPNVSGIKTRGFNLEVREGKSIGAMLGKGFYFADSPVKADQYTGRDKPECAMIITRVLLGHTAIQTKLDASSHKAMSAPCKNCFHTTPKRAEKFDSLIFEGKLFREYVVYEECLAYPEFVVKYTRSNSSTLMGVAFDHTSM